MKTVLSLIVALLAFSSSAYSADTKEGKGLDLQLGIGSTHFEHRSDRKPWNESNPGVALQYSFPGTFLGRDVEYCTTAGTIRNSEFGQTVYMGGCVRKSILEGSVGNFSLGVFAGAMTYPSRYNSARSSSELFPAVMPTASVCLKNGICVDATLISIGITAVLFMVRLPIKQW